MGYAIKALLGGSLVLALSGCGGAKEDTPAEQATTTTTVALSPVTPSATPATTAAATAEKPAAYAQCAACHSVEPGKHGIGPSLHGVYGTKAGEIPGFAFSEKLKASGLAWDDATLDKWLEAPMKMVPGTKMSYAGLKDPAKRAELIAYMKTLK